MSNNTNTKLTFNDAYEFIITTLADKQWNYRPKTIKLYSFNLKKFFSFCEERGKDLIEKISLEDVNQYFASCFRKKLSYSTIYTRYSTLSLSFSLWKDFGYIKENLMDSYKLKRSKARKIRKTIRKTTPLTREQVAKILGVIKNYSPKYNKTYMKTHSARLSQLPKITVKGKEWREIQLRDYLIIAMIYATGLRKEELLSLKKNQLNLNRRLLLSVNRKGGLTQDIVITELLEMYVYKKTKDESNRRPNDYVSLIDMLTIFIKKLKDDDYIFRTSERNVNKRCHFWAEKTEGVNAAYPHKLRHTFGSHLAELGVSPFHIKIMMAHETLQTVEIYANPEYGAVIDNWKSSGLYKGDTTLGLPNLTKKY